MVRRRNGGTVVRRYGGTAVRRYEEAMAADGCEPAASAYVGRLPSIVPPFRRSAVPPRVVPLSLLALLSLVLAPPAAAQDQIGLALGSTPAAVAVEDLEGNTVDLGTWVGKTPVVFQFWATWCPICEALAPKVQAARAAHGDAVRFVVVAVGVNQSPRRVQRYLEEHPEMGVVVWDGKGAAVRAFEAPGTSYVVALDRTGRVVHTGFGADQDIAEAFAAAVR